MNGGERNRRPVWVQVSTVAGFDASSALGLHSLDGFLIAGVHGAQVLQYRLSHPAAHASALDDLECNPGAIASGFESNELSRVPVGSQSPIHIEDPNMAICAGATNDLRELEP